MKRSIVVLAVVATWVAACSGGSSSGSTGGTGTSGTGSTSGGNPCGPNGVFGTFRIAGGVQGFESICGLQLGEFDGGTLTIAQGTSSGATVTITGSTAGQMDTNDCAASVSNCTVTTTHCAGSTDQGEAISLTLQVGPTDLSGSCSIGFNSCQAPGGAFSGSR